MLDEDPDEEFIHDWSTVRLEWACDVEQDALTRCPSASPEVAGPLQAAVEAWRLLISIPVRSFLLLYLVLFLALSRSLSLSWRFSFRIQLLRRDEERVRRLFTTSPLPLPHPLVSSCYQVCFQHHIPWMPIWQRRRATDCPLLILTWKI